MVDRVISQSIRKITQFQGMIVWTIYSPFKRLSKPYAVLYKQFQTQFIDHLNRSKAMFPFKPRLFNLSFIALYFRYLILVATSGDTGSAVLDGFSKFAGKMASNF